MSAVSAAYRVKGRRPRESARATSGSYATPMVGTERSNVK
jgi:hypothetical protein